MARAAPRLVATAVGRGLLPAGPAAVATLVREGRSELHWKVLGDSLVRFFRHSGPVLTKVGQILATRGDLLPEAICRRLEALYTGQPPMTAAQLDRALSGVYGRRRPFRRLQRRPLAVGSVGQVHRARLRDGTRIVVKIVRPDAAEQIRRDVKALRALAELVCGRLAGDRGARRMLLQAVEELGNALETETDLAREADAYEEFGARFAGSSRVVVPRCYREHSSRDLLVLEELRGKALSDLRGHADPVAARRAAHLALREILRQVFDHGRFHADPHGGNLLLLEDGRLGLIDLGLTGELDRDDRRRIARAVKAFLARDADAAIGALLEFGTVSAEFDREAFKADVAAVFRDRGRAALARAKGAASGEEEANGLEALVDEILRVAGRHGVHLPASTMLLIKTLVTIEGVARSLDPELDVVLTALPILLKSLAPRWLRWRPFAREH